MTKLLIAGATGLVGKLVLAQALADKRVDRVIALTRRPIASSDKLETVVIDFSNMPGQASWWSVDGVVCALGTKRAPPPNRPPPTGRSITIIRWRSHVMRVTMAQHASRSPHRLGRIPARLSSTHA